MKLQDFRAGLRVLIKEPAYSVVSILGLGVGLAVCMLLLGFARYSWQYDAHVPDADNVYIVKHRDNLQLGTPWYDQAPLLLREAAKTAPGVTSVSGYVAWFPLTVQVSGELRKLKSLTVLPGFAEMMGLQAIKGDLNEALSRPDTFAITQSAARRVFGTPDVLGRTVTLRLDAVDQNVTRARIAAILPDPPANTTIPFETLNSVNLGLVPQFMTAEALTGAQGWRGYLLVRIRPGASPLAVGEILQQAVDRAPSLQRVRPEVKDRLGARKVMDIKLSGLRDAYFDREVALTFVSTQVDRGNATVVGGLVAVAILILALAAINYINLATMRVIRRQREIAMRKVLGTRNGRLALLFVAESLLVSLLATGIGLALAAAALPLFGSLMNRDLSSVLSLENIAAALGVGLGVGLMTAIFPAWTAFDVRPSLMLAGRPNTESRPSRRLRQTLSVLQVTVAISLASYTMAIFWQARFAINASPGFDPSSLLVVELPTGEISQGEKPHGLIAALAQQPGVAAIAVSNDPIGRPSHAWSSEITRAGGDTVTMDMKLVSPEFFKVYGLTPVAGRLFDSRIDKETNAAAIVINALAARELGFTSPDLAVGQTLLLRSAGSPELAPKQIIGIAPEIRFNSLREVPHAVVYELREGEVLTVRASGSIADAERAIRAVWPRYYPNSVVELSTAKEIYAANYADDARLAALLAISTAIAMIIEAFGLYVLSADAVQRRTGEIALRKLFGARRRDIRNLIAREIGAILLLSTAIATPLAALAIARYLAPYTEHTALAFWALAFAPAAAVVTATLAAARQTWVAIMLRPSAALRT